MDWSLLQDRLVRKQKPLWGPEILVFQRDMLKNTWEREPGVLVVFLGLLLGDTQHSWGSAFPLRIPEEIPSQQMDVMEMNNQRSPEWFRLEEPSKPPSPSPLPSFHWTRVLT